MVRTKAEKRTCDPSAGIEKLTLPPALPLKYKGKGVKKIKITLPPLVLREGEGGRVKVKKDVRNN